MKERQLSHGWPLADNRSPRGRYALGYASHGREVETRARNTNPAQAAADADCDRDTIEQIWAGAADVAIPEAVPAAQGEPGPGLVSDPGLSAAPTPL